MDKSYKAYLAECLQLLKDSNENTRNVTALTWQQVISRSRLTGIISGAIGAAAVITFAAIIKKAVRTE